MLRKELGKDACRWNGFGFAGDAHHVELNTAHPRTKSATPIRLREAAATTT